MRVFGDEIKSNQKLKLVNSNYSFEPSEMGYFDLDFVQAEALLVIVLNSTLTVTLYSLQIAPLRAHKAELSGRRNHLFLTQLLSLKPVESLRIMLLLL